MVTKLRSRMAKNGLKYFRFDQVFQFDLSAGTFLDAKTFSHMSSGAVMFAIKEPTIPEMKFVTEYRQSQIMCYIIGMI